MSDILNTRYQILNTHKRRRLGLLVGVLWLLVILVFSVSAQGLPAPIDRNVAISAEVSGEAPPPPVVPSGGGGGGGGSASGPSRVLLDGYTSPGALVNVIDSDGNLANQTAASNGFFNFAFENVALGGRSYSVWSRDTLGARSITMSFAISVASGVSTTLSNIFLSPALTVSEPIVGLDGEINVSGTTLPQSTVRLTFSSPQIVAETAASSAGYFEYQMPAKQLGVGDHIVRGQSIRQDGLQSAVSQTVSLRVTQSGLAGSARGLRADVNNDGRVGLTDLSIILANWGNAPKNLATDINHDGRVNLVDISILLYEWT